MVGSKETTDPLKTSEPSVSRVPILKQEALMANRRNSWGNLTKCGDHQNGFFPFGFPFEPTFV